MPRVTYISDKSNGINVDGNTIALPDDALTSDLFIEWPSLEFAREYFLVGRTFEQ